MGNSNDEVLEAVNSNSTHSFHIEAWSFFRIHVASSVFPLALFVLIGVSPYVSFGLPRYDFIFLACLVTQALMVALRMEIFKELAVLSLFHVCGLALEAFKVRHGSWTYPDAGNWRIADVPIYSGFMYASVASYMLQAWRRFDLRLVEYPRGWIIFGTCTLIYSNFFLNKFWPESRWLVLALVAFAFWPSKVTFVNLERRWAMPMNLAFALLGLFIWFAEHLCSWLGAYRYPYQSDAWTWVDPGKLSAWCLLSVVCFAIVAMLKRESTTPIIPALVHGFRVNASIQK